MKIPTTSWLPLFRESITLASLTSLTFLPISISYSPIPESIRYLVFVKFNASPFPDSKTRIHFWFGSSSGSLRKSCNRTSATVSVTVSPNFKSLLLYRVTPLPSSIFVVSLTFWLPCFALWQAHSAGVRQAPGQGNHLIIFQVQLTVHIPVIRLTGRDTENAVHLGNHDNVFPEIV